MALSGFEASLQKALKLDLPYPERPSAARVSGKETPAAVLILFGEGPSVLITQRTQTVETHKGQFAFPGGRVEPEDRNAIMTALRETEEEVGIPPTAIRILGELPGIWTPTGYWITPVVGILNSALCETQIIMNPDETADAFWVPWKELVRDGVYRRETLEDRGRSFPIHVFQVGERRIWGATGAMLKNLLDRLVSVR